MLFEYRIVLTCRQRLSASKFQCAFDGFWKVLSRTRIISMAPCKSALILIALAKKRRRLGYSSPGGARLKRIMLLFSCIRLLRKQSRKEGRPRNAGRRWWIQPIFRDHDQYGAWATLIPTLRETGEDAFFEFLRMTPSAFDSLLGLVSPFLRKVSWRKAICPGERLAITLRYLATGDSQASLSYLFRVSNQAISKIIRETTTVIWHVLQHRVFPQLTENFWLKTSSEFQVLWNIPHCLGAVDGKLVYIKAFPHSGSRDFSYKKRHCKIFMAVADAKNRFIIVESGGSGKRSDASIFYKSKFYEKLLNKSLNLPPPCPVDGESSPMPFYFVGDNAYSKLQNFATPFKGCNLNDEELVYNYRLSRARRVVENAFGILCARFRILFRPIEGSPSLVSSVILACLALHNFHLLDEESVLPHRRKYSPPYYADYVREDGRVIYGRWRNESPGKESTVFNTLSSQAKSKQRSNLTGKGLQEMLLRHFIYQPVPWQWERAHLLL